MAHCSASTTNFAIEQCMPASFQPAECQKLLIVLGRHFVVTVFAEITIVKIMVSSTGFWALWPWRTVNTISTAMLSN